MAEIPKKLQEDILSEYLKENGLRRIHQGKVRDTYSLADEKLLVLASARISIFDFVLNALIPKKGEVLTAITHFWLTTVLDNFEHHLIRSVGNPRLNAVHDLHGMLPELPIERCLVVKNLKSKLYPFEMIFRHYIGGSVFKKYQETSMVGGYKLPANLPKWSKLEKPIFTPSTKEEVGHDINVDTEYFFKTMEEKGQKNEAIRVVKMLAEAYAIACTYAEEKDILILDTKFEVAGLTIVDEILTPDSSRFTLKADWKKSIEEGRDPQFLDKQPVRDWGSKIETIFSREGKRVIGINNLNPENEVHLSYVHGLEVPKEIIKDTTKRYLNLFELITGQDLKFYQTTKMGVKLQNCML